MGKWRHHLGGFIAEIRNIADGFIGAIVGGIGKIDDDFKKWRSKEFARLAKNDPHIQMMNKDIYPEQDKRKLRGYDVFHKGNYRQTPKMHEQKYLNKQGQEKDE